jgi:uncharacterized membrane protein YdbT with pleckstrin-like domain
MCRSRAYGEAVVTEDDRAAIRHELSRRRSAMTRILILAPILVVGMLLVFGPLIGLIWLVLVAFAVTLAVTHYRRIVDAANEMLGEEQ